MSVLIDLNKSCLICLQDVRDLVSVYEKDEHTPQFTIVEKIARCSNLCLETKSSSKLPDKICPHCLEDLSASWRFRENCENANSLFNSIEQQELDEFELEIQKLALPVGVRVQTKDVAGLKDDTNAHTVPKKHAEEEEEAIVVLEVESVDVDTNSYEGDEVLNEEETEEHLDDDDSAKDQLQIDTQSESSDCEEVQDTVQIKYERDKGAAYEAKLKITEDIEVVPTEDLPKRGRGRPRKFHFLHNAKADNVQVKMDGENAKRVRYLKKPVYAEKSTSKPKINVKPLNSLKQMIDADRKAHSPDAKICEICGNTYKYQHALIAHMRRHNNERPFACEFCEKAFVSGVELRRHMRVHTGHKPYPCKYCDRRFSDFGSRIKHERTHTGERPYACNTCGKSFAYAHVLSVHLRTHTGEKRFKCSRCGKGFTKKVYLESHMQHYAKCAENHVQLDSDNVPMEVGEQQQQQQQEQLQPDDDGDSMDVKSLPVEECIFTTEYIAEDDKEEYANKFEIYELEEVDDQMTEEHLDEDDNIKYELRVTR